MFIANLCMATANFCLVVVALHAGNSLVAHVGTLALAANVLAIWILVWLDEGKKKKLEKDSQAWLDKDL